MRLLMDMWTLLLSELWLETPLIGRRFCGEFRDSLSELGDLLDSDEFSEFDLD